MIPLQIFHSICRVADVLTSLQQYGNDKYIGWARDFSCSSDDLLNKLQVQACEMEKDLAEWKKQLSRMRDKFYELNYFTTPQLLLLREELGQFKNNPDTTKPVKHEVISLLQSLSQKITSDSVKEYVVTVSAAFAEQELVFGTYYGMLLIMIHLVYMYIYIYILIL